MNIVTEKNFTGLMLQHPFASKFQVLAHSDGSMSVIPHGFFRTWLDEEPNFGTFVIGRSSGFGLGSIVKYDGDVQKLVVGRYVAGGLRLRFLLNGQHETDSISMTIFEATCPGIKNPLLPQYGDTVLKNDIWIGDEAMFLGGSVIENGCIIGARALVPPEFTSEPYGIYVGTPARLVKFRFSEKVREALVKLAWWELPLSWVKENNDAFLMRLSKDEAKSLDMLAELESNKSAFNSQATSAKNQMSN